MKTELRLAAIFVVLSFSVALGQSRGLVPGSAAAEAFRAGARGAAINAAMAEGASWRDSTKLTVLDVMPKKCRHPVSAAYCSDCLSVSRLKSDSVGYLECWEFSVLQITGPTDLLLSMRKPESALIWLTGHSSKGLVDGDRVRLVGLLEVDGTKRYRTVSGSSKTVRVVRLVSKVKLAEIAANENERARVKADKVARVAAAKLQAGVDAKLAKASVAAAKREAEFRTWTSTVGTTIEARFAGLIGPKVILEKRDGKKIRVPLDKLSDTDQKFMVAKRKEATEASGQAAIIARKLAKKKEEAAQREAEFRTWNSRNFSTLEARLDSFDENGLNSNKIVLEKRDGFKFSEYVGNLSDPDKEFVAEWRKKHAPPGDRRKAKK